MQVIERWTHHLFPLAAGNKAWKGGAAGIDPGTGKVEPMSAQADLVYIGNFDEEIDATAGDTMVNVDLGTEIEVRRYLNDTGSAVDAGDVGSLCNFLDDQTVSMAAGPVAGRVWDVHPTLGVAVQKLQFVSEASP
jgi:hypothetical protein